MSRGLLWLSLCVLCFGCGLDPRPKEIDEPCTRPSQCVAGLTCLTGVCLPDPDAGVDAGADSGP